MEKEIKKSNNDEEKIKIAKLLTQLALIKNAERSENQLAAMAGYLGNHFSFGQISLASEYLLQSSKYFPDISEYFQILKPIKSLEQNAMDYVLKMKELMREHPTYSQYTSICKIYGEHVLLEIVKKIGWNDSLTIKDRDLLEIIKALINKPELYLKTTHKQLEQ